MPDMRSPTRGVRALRRPAASRRPEGGKGAVGALPRLRRLPRHGRGGATGACGHETALAGLLMSDAPGNSDGSARAGRRTCSSAASGETYGGSWIPLRHPGGRHAGARACVTPLPPHRAATARAAKTGRQDARWNGGGLNPLSLRHRGGCPPRFRPTSQGGRGAGGHRAPRHDLAASANPMLAAAAPTRMRRGRAPTAGRRPPCSLPTS